MPELPELEVVCEVLQRRIVGQTIAQVEVIPPGGAIVVRDLTGAGFKNSLSGATIQGVQRRGKFLLFSLAAGEPSLHMVINHKLTGRLRLSHPKEKLRAKTHVVLTFASDLQLRYYDQKQMGQIYLTRALETILGFAEMGPEPLELDLQEFRRRLKPLRGEIKGVLVRGDFVAGIGNAYADEILWEARLHPYRKCAQLTESEVERLYQGMRDTLLHAIQKVRVEIGDEQGDKIDQEPRAFFAVHMKTDLPCPRCGTSISLISANQRITNFCRNCQPGGLIAGMH